MTQDDFNLFEAEDRLLRESRALLDGGQCGAAAVPMARLLAGYECLLRESKQLIRLSDRREKELNRLNKRLEQLSHSLAYQAEHDFLTGCLNRGAMSSRLEAALQEGEVGLVAFDIDHFKRVNDTHGHPAGDAVLKAVADAVHDALGAEDAFGRMGGEEFAVLLPAATMARALATAEGLRRTVAALRVAGADQTLQVTISLGVTRCHRGETTAEVLSRADRALYAAKSGGRDRVESAP